MGRGRDAALPAGALWQRARRRHRAGAGGGDRAGVDAGGKSRRLCRLPRPQAAGSRAAGQIGAHLRHPRRRVQRDRSQHPAGFALLLDTDVPFVPHSKRAREMKWVQIDIDPLKSDFPMWGFATDMRVQGDSAVILQQVLEAVEARADDAYRKRIAARIESWSAAREASAKRRTAASGNKGISGALNTPFVFATLGGKLAPDDVVLNEAIRN